MRDEGLRMLGTGRADAAGADAKLALCAMPLSCNVEKRMPIQSLGRSAHIAPNDRNVRRAPENPQ
ncbi:hypothetical protein, partial [Mesorhizobium sp.]|uniref:hypothetical protein n=1 Tax=Mesorhizobium sp. TaxID=1871066 RepID=UPI0025B7AAA4